MKTLHETLTNLERYGHITGSTDADDGLHVHLDQQAKAAIVAWYMRDEEIIGEALCDCGDFLAESVDTGDAPDLMELGRKTYIAVERMALEWVRVSPEGVLLEERLREQDAETGKADPCDIAKEAELEDES